MKKVVLVFSMIIIIFIPISNALRMALLSLFFFYIAYDIGIKKNLTLATLVKNPQEPTEQDTINGQTTTFIMFILAISLIIFSIYLFLSH